MGVVLMLGRGRFKGVHVTFDEGRGDSASPASRLSGAIRAIRVQGGTLFRSAVDALRRAAKGRVDFDKLRRVSHAAIVENKRLGEILAWIKEQQDSQPRFNRVPDGPRRSNQKPGILKHRAMKIVEAAKPNLPA
jgi:hypothetical protein